MIAFAKCFYNALSLQPPFILHQVNRLSKEDSRLTMGKL